MLTALMLATLAVVGSELPEPVYVLDYPGLAFEYLPEVMSPPVEGTMTEERGVLTSDANSEGIEFQLHYWKEELEENSRKDIWLGERFPDTVSPDLLPSLLIGQVEWTEGSTGTDRRVDSSIGLVPVLNFNIINENGDIVGRGRACAVFPDDYSVLLYAMAPASAETDIREEFDTVVSGMFLSGE